MTILEELKTLKEYTCSERCVLSVYLNTNPADPEQLNGAWRIHLKTGLKRIGEYLEASGDEKEMQAFSAVKKKVMNEIDDNQNNFRKGIVIFASSNDDLWSVHYVQVPVKTNLYFEDHAVTEQFEYMYKAYPEAGILMPSFGEVRILDTALGYILDDITYKYDLVSEQWMTAGIDAKGNRISAKSKTASLEPRMRLNASSFFREMGSTIDHLKKKRGWRELHVAGEAEIANAFTDSLRDIPASCIYKNLNNSKANEIVRQVLENLK